MSKIESQSSNQKDLYAVWRESIDSFYTNIEKSIPQFHQATTNLIQEYLKSWNNVAVSFINLQKEFATKAGIKSNMPEAALKIAHDANEELNKAVGIQNKMTIASIDATKQNIKTWNNSSEAFVDLNKGIVDSWISTINPRG